MTSQNVRMRPVRVAKKQALLERETFLTSREMDFFSEKELVTQTGHDVGEWPLVILKETIDNALDACEEADTAPIIEVFADEAGITVSDNGPGLPESTLRGALDFTVRASNREAYVAPDRGAQGNALKTLLPMPRVLDPEHGRFIVEAYGKRHVITCGADPISQNAVVNDDVTDLPNCKNRPSCDAEESVLNAGTTIRIEWSAQEYDDGETVWPFDDLVLDYDRQFVAQFRCMVEGFAVFNPHATFRLNWFGQETTWEATDPASKKWKPNRPTSAHWYELQHLDRLIGACITKDREEDEDRLISDFIKDFDGLSGSQKRSMVLNQCDLKRVPLSAFVVDGRLDSDRIQRLLSAMQEHTRPVKPKALGLIGEEHLKARLLAMGVKEESFRYKKKLSKDGVPWVLESAFGWCGNEAANSRRIVTGANWSAAIKSPFRSFGRTGEGLETVLHKQRAGAREPIVFVLHLAHPRVEYTDRGKSALVIGGAA